MTTSTQISLDRNGTASGEHRSEVSEAAQDPVVVFKRRMLAWSNPVEYVNNMYGCHPGDGDGEEDYFRNIFRE
jgi:hypothetical protein